MTLPDFGPGVQGALRVQRILWFALIMAVVVMCAIAFLVIVPSPHPMEPAMPLIMGGIALSCLVLSVFLPAHMFKLGMAQRKFEIVERAVASSDILPSAAQPKARYFAHPDRALMSTMPMFQTGVILRLALRESVGMFGLTLRQLGAPTPVVVAFFAVSLLALLASFPTIGALVRKLEASANARFG